MEGEGGPVLCAADASIAVPTWLVWRPKTVLQTAYCVGYKSR